MYANKSFYYTKCDGVQTDSQIAYPYYSTCCEGNDCNHNISDVDLSSCTHDTSYETIWQDYHDCIAYTSGSAFETYLCDDDAMVTCDGLLAVFMQSAECQCERDGAFYNLADSTSQATLQSDIDDELRRFSDWNDVFGCDIQLSCDLGSGGMVVNSGSSNTSGTISTSTTTTKATVTTTSTTLGANTSSGNMMGFDMIQNDKVYFVAILLSIIACIFAL